MRAAAANAPCRFFRRWAAFGPCWVADQQGMIGQIAPLRKGLCQQSTVVNAARVKVLLRHWDGGDNRVRRQGKGTRGCHAVRQYLRAFGDAAVFEHQHQLPRNAVVAPHSGGVRRKRSTRQAQIIQHSEADRTNRVRQGQRAAGQAENVLREQRIIHIGQRRVKNARRAGKSGMKAPHSFPNSS